MLSNGLSWIKYFKFPSLNFLSLGTFLFCWNTVGMPVSLPSDILLEVHPFAHSLLQRQLDTVHQVMSFLGKTAFCASGYAQLCQFGCVICCDMLNVYHSPAHSFLLFQLIFSSMASAS